MLYLPRRHYTAPALPPHHVARPRVQQLLAPQAQQITVVTAGAGSGKTLAVRETLQAQDAPVLWTTMATMTSAPAIVGLLARSAAQAGLPTPPDLEAWLSSEPACWPALLDHLLDGWQETPSILVVDRYDEGRDPAVSACLQALTAGLPEHTSLYLIGRTEPLDLGLATWRVQQQVRDIDAAALHFTATELAAVITALTDLSLPVTDLEVLESQAGSWIAGLVLAIHAWHSRGNANLEGILSVLQDASDTIPYLVREILDRQSPDMQHLLLRAARLPWIDPDACQQLLECAMPAAWAQPTQRAQYFMAPNGAGQLEFQPLFRAGLLTLGEQRLTADERTAIEDGIRQWFGDLALLDGQVQRNDGSKALNTLAMLADEYLIADDSVNLGALLAAFPSDAHQDPWWQLLSAEVSRKRGDTVSCLALLTPLMAHAEPAVRSRTLAIQAAVLARQGAADDAARAIEAAAESIAPGDHLGRGYLWLVRGGSAILRSDGPGAEAAFDLAMQTFRLAGHAVGEAKACLYLAQSRFNLGLIASATPLIDRAEALYREAGWTTPVLTALLRGAIAYHQGDFGRSLMLFDQGSAIAAALQDAQMLVRVRLLRAEVLLGLGDVTGARHDFEQSLASSRWTGLIYDSICAMLGLAETARRQQELGLARRWLERAVGETVLPDGHPLHLRRLMITVRLLLQAGQPDEAATVLDDVERCLAVHDQPMSRAEALSLKAALHRHRGEQASGDVVAAECAELCRRYGYGFLAQYDAADELVAVAQTHLTIRCFGHFDVQADGSSIFPPTWKGRQILLLLIAVLLTPAGLSRDELAGQLYPKQRISRTAISVLVNRLRRATAGEERPWNALGGLIVSQQGRYQLNPALRVTCDLTDFEAAWQDAQQATDDPERAKAYRRLVDLYAGPLFQGFHDEGWVLVAHHRTRQQWQTAHHWLHDWLRRQGDLATALALTEQHLAVDAADETAHRRKIELLLDLGQRPEARQQYAIMVRCLSEQSGAVPDQASRALLQRLQAD